MPTARSGGGAGPARRLSHPAARSAALRQGRDRVGFERLSPESRYRVFTAMSSSRADLRYLTEVDHVDHEAVLASPRGEPVGVAYSADRGPSQAEFGAVVDTWQNRGTGTALLERLVERPVERIGASSPRS